MVTASVVVLRVVGVGRTCQSGKKMYFDCIFTKGLDDGYNCRRAVY